MTELTLVFLVDEARVLLAMKKKGFGAGKYNGLGGKIEPGETEEQAMVREAQEEAFVTPLNFKYVADITFDEFYGTKKTVNHAHVYLCYEWEGEPKESEEMIPEWFDKDSLPLHDMWDDDQYWLPRVLVGEKLRCVFQLDQHDKVISQKIETLR